MLSVSEMVDVLDFDFDMENGEKVAQHYHCEHHHLITSTSHSGHYIINIFIAVCNQN